MKKANSEKRIANSQEQEQLKGQLARALADYDNLVKRIDRERNEVKKLISLSLILKLLTVLDGLKTAQEHLKDQGLAISIVEFQKVLSEEGLTEINPEVGSEFDENTMEAIEVVDGESNNMISRIALVGYKFNDGTIVRHAKVVVTKQK